jgi:hypothetical protein
MNISAPWEWPKTVFTQCECRPSLSFMAMRRKVCGYCGALFYYKQNPNTRYCSMGCRYAFHDTNRGRGVKRVRYV